MKMARKSKETRIAPRSWAKTKGANLLAPLLTCLFSMSSWLRGVDSNHRPLGYELVYTIKNKRLVGTDGQFGSRFIRLRLVMIGSGKGAGKTAAWLLRQQRFTRQ
jgi:hypothetical protein